MESVDFVRTALGDRRQVILQSNKHFVLFWKIKFSVKTDEAIFLSDKFYVENSGLHLQLALRLEHKHGHNSAYVTVFHVRGRYDKQVHQCVHEMSICFLNQQPLKRQDNLMVTDLIDFGSKISPSVVSSMYSTKSKHLAKQSVWEDCLFKLDWKFPEMKDSQHDDLLVTFHLK